MVVILVLFSNIWVGQIWYMARVFVFKYFSYMFRPDWEVVDLGSTRKPIAPLAR